MRNANLRLLLGVVVLLTAVAAVRAEEAKQIAILQKWDGMIKDRSVQTASPMTSYIANEKEFVKLWSAWRPDEKVPKVDFDKEIVLVGLAGGPNKPAMTPQLNDKGDLHIRIRSEAVGGAGFGYQIVVVQRAGITTIKGKPIVNE